MYSFYLAVQDSWQVTRKYLFDVFFLCLYLSCEICRVEFPYITYFINLKYILFNENLRW